MKNIFLLIFILIFLYFICNRYIENFSVGGQSSEKTPINISGSLTLPYINGCSTNNILPPIRSGDPCMQVLKIPAGCSEQKHHIHSTDRVVYVLSGSGTTVCGVGSNAKKSKLTEGTTLILNAMEPHHFETDKEDLIVVPMHIWSSTNEEFNHPMMLGTHAL